ncbi:glycosyltransferase family 4 protein [Methylobacterium sp. DB0501]|uniref:glycosyltransferase n=1 Tax=Methylobacterium sp. DB0501 TaxID=2709665 RepID=UPI0013EB8499|nr:glycosyltransferase [Methylobacterium sp. DB0501]NGM34047.1 glycosyltransferase family 4 protein [Methylobacterium sp. DB0501]
MAKFLVLNFFPCFYPPLSGGEMRVYYLYNQLAKSNEIIMITSTDFGARYEEINHSQSFKEIRFPKDIDWRNAYEALTNLGIEGEMSGLAFALAVADSSCKLRMVAREIASEVDFIIHEFPFSEPIFSDGIFGPEIYNSHNFEASLLSSVVRGSGFDKSILKLMRIEGNLCHRAHRIFATSQADAEKFEVFYGVSPHKISICANGYDESEAQKVYDIRQSNQDSIFYQRPVVSFLGSAHYPNVEAAQQIFSIASEVPDADFIIAGAVCDHLKGLEAPSNLEIVGHLQPSEKFLLLSKTTILINPVILGSGTSLKSIEAMAFGVPMLTTVEGIRGLEIDPANCVFVSDRAQFADRLNELIFDKHRLRAVALAARVEVQSTYSWQAICKHFENNIRTSISEEYYDDRVNLFVNDYDIGTGEWGGAARIMQIINCQRGRNILISFSDSFKVDLIGPKNLKVTIPKTPAHLYFERKIAAGEQVSANDIVAALFAPSNYLLRRLCKYFVRRTNVIVLEHCYMGSLIDVIKSNAQDIPIIYSAHNVESALKTQLLQNHRSFTELTDFVNDLEALVCKFADMVVCVTEADAEIFRSKGNHVIVCANGSNLIESAESESKIARVGTFVCGFVASSHSPNIDAAKFICYDLAKKLPNIQFEIVGGVCSALSDVVPPNVTLMGVLNDFEKTKTMLKWNLALNPVDEGGGSSLKLPDYMAHGLATINTPTGARGFRIEETRSGKIAVRSEFAREIKRLSLYPEEIDRMSKNAYSYVKRALTWPAVSKDYKSYIDNFPRAQRTINKPSLLVVTYRYTEPSRGGAEEYLIEILKEIRDSFEWIDLSATNIDDITNQYHFGSTYTVKSGRASSRVAELFDQQFYFMPSEIDKSAAIKNCQELELFWKNEEELVFSHFVEALLGQHGVALLSGFYDAERTENGFCRWSAPRFAFAIKSNSRYVILKGFGSVPKAALVSIRDIDGKVIKNFSVQLDTWFELKIKIETHSWPDILAIHIEVPEHTSDLDHRVFGLYIERIEVLSDDMHQSQVCDLSVRNDQIIGVKYLEKWMETLDKVASARNMTLDAKFNEVRGPTSNDQIRWIKEFAHNYTHIIVQGIPFNTIPEVVNALESINYRGRIVTLPHFHGDDRFYYWNSYFQAFERSSANIFFSDVVAQQMGRHGYSTVVPGGGVNIGDLGSPTCIRSFRSAHKSTRPFYLILGRKTASKGYDAAIRAYMASKSRSDFDLVMIGQDEDKEVIDVAGVYYLGPQPRDVVLGALSACKGLISMSTSESFGIVLCEAWLFKKPVIANAACYSFRELIQKTGGGYLVESDEELTAAMEDIMINDEKCTRFGGDGFASTIENFTWPAVAKHVRETLLQTGVGIGFL